MGLEAAVPMIPARKPALRNVRGEEEEEEVEEEGEGGGE